MIKSLSKIFEPLLFLFLVFIAVFLCISGNLSKAVTEGISLWASCVVPSIFPYLFLTAILSQLYSTKKVAKLISPITTKVFNISGNAGFSFLLSILSGYPIGAKTVSELRLSNLLNDEESVRAACLCSTSSPMFLIGSVGGIMFNDKFFGAILFLTHILATLLNGFIFSFYKRTSTVASLNKTTNSKSFNLLYDSAYSSVISILIIGSLITVFYLLTEILVKIGILSPFINALTLLTKNENLSSGIIFGIFECTKGMKALSILPKKIALPFCAFLSSFGGLSVIAQSVAYLKKAKIKTAPFLLSKVTAAVISLILGFIFSFLL